MSAAPEYELDEKYNYPVPRPRAGLRRISTGFRICLGALS